jgi:hypothetical protein
MVLQISTSEIIIIIIIIITTTIRMFIFMPLHSLYCLRKLEENTCECYGWRELQRRTSVLKLGAESYLVS